MGSNPAPALAVDDRALLADQPRHPQPDVDLIFRKNVVRTGGLPAGDDVRGGSTSKRPSACLDDAPPGQARKRCKPPPRLITIRVPVLE